MGDKKFGVDWANLFPPDASASPFARSDAAPEGNAAPAVWNAMGDVGTAIRDYHPGGFDTPNVAPPPAVGNPADNNIHARPPAAATPGAEAQPMSVQDRLDLAQRKLASGLPLDQGDMLMLDDAYRQANQGGKEASSTTSGISRALAPKGKEWDQLQADQAEGLTRRNEVRAKEMADTAALSRLQDEHAQASSQRADAYGRELTNLTADQQKAQALYTEQLGRDRADQDKANAAYQRAAADYDPNRLMRGGHGVMAALSLAMGAFGSSLTKTQNSALEIINDQISRDMDKQKTGIAAQKEKATWMDHVMSANRERFKDETTARLMTRASAKEAYGTWMEGQAAKATGDEQRAARQKEVADLNMSAQMDRKQGWDLHEARLRQQAGTATSQTTTSQADTITRPGDFIKRLDAEATAEKKRRDAYGMNGEKLSPADAAFTNKQLGSIAEIAASSKGLKDLEAQRAKSNPISRFLGVGEGGKQNVTEEVQAQKYGKAISGTQSSEPEHERIKKVVSGGAFSFLDEAKNRGPEQLRRNAIDEARAKFMAVPEAAKSGVAARLVKMGWDPDEVEQIVNGTAPVDRAAEMAAGGGR